MHILNPENIMFGGLRTSAFRRCQFAISAQRMALAILWLLTISPFAFAQDRLQPAMLEQVRLINQDVAKLYGQGKYDEALGHAKQALALSESGLGAEHASTAASLTNLALLHRTLGDYDKALPLYLRALAIFEKVKGVEHAATGACLNSLAGVYEAQGEYEKALPLYLRALAISEKSPGQEHPTTGIRLSNLAGLYESMAAYDKALPLYLRALAIFEYVHGPHHIATGTSLNNLAALYSAMGEYEKALPLYLRALAIAEATQGAHHPDTGARLNNLAELYRSIGAYDKALPLYLRSLAIAEKAQGLEHRVTGIRLNNLALLYQAMGAYDKALPLHQRALAMAEKMPGQPSTTTRLNNLAGLYKSTRAFDKALPLYQRALARTEKSQGLAHPDTASSLGNLAGLYEAMGKYDIALPLYLRALAIAEKTQGPAHPATVTHVNNLAALYQAMDGDGKALPLYQRALATAFVDPARDPNQLATVARNICLLHQETKLASNNAEAIFYCKLAVNTRQKQRIASRALPLELQHSLAKKGEGTYLLLNRLLNKSNRATEAAQVMLALKDAEFADFTGDQITQKNQVDLTKSEADLSADLLESAAKLRQWQSEFDAIRQAKASQQELEKLDSLILIAKAHLSKAFSDIAITLKDSNKEAAQQFKIDNNLFVKHLANLNAATPVEKNLIVAINALSTRTQISTYYDQQPLQLDLDVGTDKLLPLIDAMRSGILAKNDDWRKPAQALYQLLIVPLEAQLKHNKLTAQNLTLYISGQLRSLPLAALLDANGQFLTSKYRLNLYNPRFGTNALRDWSQDWNVNAFGSTQGKAEAKLLALPSVAKELSNIVRTDTSRQGILPGEIYLDSQFTRKTWSQAVAASAAEKKRRVLHVATHFQIDTNIYQSKLLLGDGEFYRVEELAAEPGLSLAHVDLVTLSACETMLAGKGRDSAEFESLGALFQSKGANAVLGTLWPVFDGSTAELMQKFYANRGEQRKMSKAQALQEAQQAMLASEKWRHPYYWAGFILMGNWL